MPRTTVWQFILTLLAAFLLGGVFAVSAADQEESSIKELDANEAAAEASDAGIDMIELDANQAEDESEADGDENAAEDLLAEVAFGEPRDCINTQRIRSTEVLSDREILFRISGTEFYLNKLPHRCSGLRMADAFSYEVRGSQLCAIDLIRVVNTFGGGIRPGIACGLGKFLPVSEEQIPLVRERAKVKD